jgi:hypothetical protein
VLFTTSENFKERLRSLFGLKSIEEESPLVKYLREEYEVIPDIAYEQKREIKGFSYNVFLNELIVPNAFEVRHFLKGVVLTSDGWQRARNVGNLVAKRLTWRSDKNLLGSDDYYLYPSEVLALREGDCEDHAFLMASLLPGELGVAYGFWDNGSGKRIAHAFNVLLYKGELFTLDTVSDNVSMLYYDERSTYTIHYVVTQDATFQLVSGTDFGRIAGW